MKISPADHQRIAEAVAKAEHGTSGEIRCVLADGAVGARHNALIWAAGAALLLPALALLLGFHPQALTRVFGVWTIGQLAAQDGQIAVAIASYILVQAAVFVVVWLLASWTPLRRTLTPSGLARRHVHVAAVEQFTALGLHRTRDRTGVLLFASLAERRAEVLADDGIYAKAPNAVWDEVVALLVAGLKSGAPADGFVTAVGRTGQILAAHLPPRRDDVDELPDDITETR